MSRFAPVDADLIKELTNASTPANTAKSTKQWVSTFDKWAVENGIVGNIETFPPNELNSHLEKFYASLQKADGKPYEPACLKVMLAALDRHLKANKYPVSISKDRQFLSSKKVLEGKVKQLRRSGMGNRPNRARSLSSEEEDILWRNGQFGMDTPRSLLQAFWWTVHLQFGLRGCENHYTLNINDFQIKTDDQGRRYLHFVEGPNKNHQGGLNYKPRLIFPRAYETGSPRCPVAIFAKFQRKRPEHLRQDGPLYLAIIDNPSTDIWYKVSRLGVKKLQSMMKDIKENSPLSTSDKKITNHSTKKTVVRKMKNSGIQKHEIINVTGHSSVSGLDPYDSGNDDDLNRYSNALSDGLSTNAPKLGGNSVMDSHTCTKSTSGSELAGVQFSFSACSGVTVNINNSSESATQTTRETRRRLQIMSSPENSQE